MCLPPGGGGWCCRLVHVSSCQSTGLAFGPFVAGSALRDPLLPQNGSGKPVSHFRMLLVGLWGLVGEFMLAMMMMSESGLRIVRCKLPVRDHIGTSRNIWQKSGKVSG